MLHVLIGEDDFSIRQRYAGIGIPAHLLIPASRCRQPWSGWGWRTSSRTLRIKFLVTGKMNRKVFIEEPNWYGDVENIPCVAVITAKEAL